MPRLDVDARGDAGLPVVVVKRELGQRLFEGVHQARVSVELESELRPLTGSSIHGGAKLGS